MNSLDDLSNSKFEGPISLSRSPSTFDLFSLHHNTLDTSRKSKGRCSVSSASPEQSECHDSEDSQILYMAPYSKRAKRAKKLRSVLSSIGNQEAHVMDGTSDVKVDALDCCVSEGCAWSVIDREIFEWQYVCRTGRPYWWSPELRYTRPKQLPSRFSSKTPSQSWMRRADNRTKCLCRKQRRAISEGHWSGEDQVEDLAHLVAVQLLSSCFTLPPDRNGLPAPDFTSYNLNGPPNTLDPRLISSLRMHTQFRYSPSFGHQARNTSPAQPWSGSCDGASPCSSPPYAGHGFENPVIGTSGSPPRRRKPQRTLNVTESSANSCRLDNESQEYVNSASEGNLDPTALAPAWYCRQGIDDNNARPTTLPCLPGQDVGGIQYTTSGRTHSDLDMPDSYRAVQSRSRQPRANYILEPVIRSEPHHVFVQPVKEMVVKRWKTFHRRFAGSLHAHLPTDSNEFMSETSSPMHSGTSSPAMSSDARARRRRAQERGEIHSSIDSGTHNNPPPGGYGKASNLPSSFWVDSVSPSPHVERTDAVEAAAAALATRSLSTSVTCPSLSAPQEGGRLRSSSNPSLKSIAVPHPRPKLNHQSMPSTDELRSWPNSRRTHSSQSYTNRMRQRRKSILSEIYTRDDLDEIVPDGEAEKDSVNESILVAGESSLASPDDMIEMVESDKDKGIRPRASSSKGNLGLVLPASPITPPTLELSRVSTAGTQVFTTGDEGVEIDGLPAGPSKELWDGVGKRNERSYL